MGTGKASVAAKRGRRPTICWRDEKSEKGGPQARNPNAPQFCCAYEPYRLLPSVVSQDTICPLSPLAMRFVICLIQKGRARCSHQASNPPRQPTVGEHIDSRAQLSNSQTTPHHPIIPNLSTFLDFLAPPLVLCSPPATISRRVADAQQP